MNQLCQGDPFDVDVAPPGFNLRKIEHPINESQEVFSVLQDPLDVQEVLLVQFSPFFLEENIGKPDDGIQRGAQFMADNGKELAFCVIRFFCPNFRQLKQSRFFFKLGEEGAELDVHPGKLVLLLHDFPRPNRNAILKLKGHMHELPDAQEIEPTSEAEHHQDGKRIKDPRLIEQGLDFEHHDLSVLIPDPVFVGRGDAKGVRPRGNFCIISRSPASRINPSLVESLEPVSVRDALRSRVIQAGVMEFEPVRPRWEVHQAMHGNRTTVGNKPFYDHRRRRRIGRDLVRIDDNEPFDRGEPQPPVRRFPPRRLKASVAFPV